MALQVWLPLNGNLQNQGVSGVSFTTNGSVGYSVGKVTTHCMKTNWTTVDNTKANNVHSVANLTPPSQYSISLWFKITTNSATVQHIYQYGGSDYSSDSSVALGVGLCVNGTTLQLNRNSARANVMTGLSINKWYHAVVIDNNKVLTVYVDGVQKYTFTNTRPYATNHPLVIGSLHATSWYTFFGEVNDFRLYDHCLSVKEVKNLAKGLMLHYKLSRSGANLLKNTATEKSWTYSGTSYSDSNYSQETITPASGSYYTMSFDAKSNRNSTSNFITYLYNNNSGRQCDNVKGYIDGQLVYTGSGGDGACVMPTYTYYRHYTIIRHFNTNATALTKQNVFRIYNAGSTALTMYVKNAKIELGDKSTPWIPNSADTLYSQMGLNNNIESDNSGYGNNGTRLNITTWNTDTARYLSSMTFASNSYVKTNAINFNGTTNNYTISWWGNFSSASSAMFWGFNDGNRLNLFMSSNYFYWNTGDGLANPFYSSGTTQLSASPYADSKWHHFTIVGNGTSVILYIDGSQKATAKTYKNITGTIIYLNGWDTSTSYKFNGRMSDFRIYATALSSDDVKELYNVGASIDKNGNMHCYELVES